MSNRAKTESCDLASIAVADFIDFSTTSLLADHTSPLLPSNHPLIYPQTCSSSKFGASEDVDSCCGSIVEVLTMNL